MYARSVAAAAINYVTGEFQSKLTPSHEHIRSWVEGLPGPVAVTYEAGPTGFDLCRALTAVGIRCEVAAPSKLQRPAGDRVKTDVSDATWLAQLGAHGLVRASFSSVGSASRRWEPKRLRFRILLPIE